MKATIVRIGNSRSIRIPNPVFDRCGFEDEVEMEIHNHELVIRSVRASREGWDKAFQSMAQHQDDTLADRTGESYTKWDDEEWEWK